MINFKVIAALCGLLILGGCSDGPSNGNSTQFKKAKASSLDRCIVMTQRSSGSLVDSYTADRPDYVAGKLENGQDFWCKKIKTGTSGVYWEAAYY